MNMNEKQLMAEFDNNIKANFSQLQDLFKAYDLAALGYDMQDEQSRDAHNRVLANNTFYAARDCKRANLAKGDRITDETFAFLLSDADKSEFVRLSTIELTKDGVTDERGYYVTDWLGIKGDARRKLVAFIIDELLPWEMQLQFKPYEANIVQTEKLLDIVRPIVTKAA